MSRLPAVPAVGGPGSLRSRSSEVLAVRGPSPRGPGCPMFRTSEVPALRGPVPALEVSAVPGPGPPRSRLSKPSRPAPYLHSQPARQSGHHLAMHNIRKSPANTRSLEARLYLHFEHTAIPSVRMFKTLHLRRQLWGIGARAPPPGACVRTPTWQFPVFQFILFMSKFL